MFQLKVSTCTIKKKDDFWSLLFLYICCSRFLIVVFTEELEEIILVERYRSVMIISTKAS